MGNGNFVEKMHIVSITGIVVKEGKFLITKRALTKKLFPGKWTVPGGNLELTDYINLPKDTKEHWYNVLEKVLILCLFRKILGE